MALMTSRNERAEASANVAEMHKAPFAPLSEGWGLSDNGCEGGLTVISGLVVLCALTLATARLTAIRRSS